MMAEPVDQNATQTLLGLSFHQAIVSTTSLSFCLSELKQFTHILWGMVKGIRGNAGYQYLKLKYTNQDKGNRKLGTQKSQSNHIMSK